jgi:hypothetical protein
MSQYETLTLLIALLGVVISVISLIRTRRLDQRQERLQSKQEELTELQIQLLRREVEDQQRRQQQSQAAVTPPAADVRVTLEGSGAGERFVITNWGYGAARSVDFKLRVREGRPSPLVKGDYDEKLPIRELLPGDRASFIAALTFGTGTTFDAVLTWTNADGTRRTRETQVSR